MAVKILYVDIRDEKQMMESFVVEWNSGLTAREAVEQALTRNNASEIAHHLHSNNSEITVAWHDEKIEEHSEVGGIGNLDWQIPDKSVLTVVYENERTTPQQIDMSSDWMIENSSGE